MGRGCLVFQGLRKGLKDYIEDRARPRTYCATQMLPASSAPSIFLINTLCNNRFLAASVGFSLPSGERVGGEGVGRFSSGSVSPSPAPSPKREVRPLPQGERSRPSASNELSRRREGRSCAGRAARYSSQPAQTTAATMPPRAKASACRAAATGLPRWA